MIIALVKNSVTYRRVKNQLRNELGFVVAGLVAFFWPVGLAFTLIGLPLVLAWKGLVAIKPHAVKALKAMGCAVWRGIEKFFIWAQPKCVVIYEIVWETVSYAIR